MCELCNIWACVCVCWFCKLRLYVRMDFVNCGCVYVWIFKTWFLYVYVGFEMCGCVYM